jgi:hypothetical protein
MTLNHLIIRLKYNWGIIRDIFKRIIEEIEEYLGLNNDDWNGKPKF